MKFPFSLRPPRRLGRAVLCVLLLLSALLLLRGPAPTPRAGTPSPNGVSSEADRQAYLQSWGWLVSPQPVLVEELRLPRSFDGPYADFLALQTAQGFSQLERYAGKRVTRYTYEVLNAPGHAALQVRILLRGSQVLAGEVIGPDRWQGLDRSLLDAPPSEDRGSTPQSGQTPP